VVTACLFNHDQPVERTVTTKTVGQNPVASLGQIAVVGGGVAAPEKTGGWDFDKFVQVRSQLVAWH
jgi:hypothetical protein